MLKKICSILSSIVLIVLTVVAVALVVPKFMGYNQFAVLSGSMEPNIHVGAIVYAKDVEPAELEVGDIVTYQISGNTMVTHRIVAINEATATITTKGDANETEDASPVSYESIVGKYAFDIPYLGYISIYAKTPIGIGAICGVLIVIILLNFLPDALTEEEKKDEKGNSKKTKKK